MQSITRFTHDYSNILYNPQTVYSHNIIFLPIYTKANTPVTTDKGRVVV